MAATFKQAASCLNVLGMSFLSICNKVCHKFLFGKAILKMQPLPGRFRTLIEP